MVDERKYKYDIFISYCTDPDYKLVQKLESFLETFHKLKTPSNLSLRCLQACVDGSDFTIPRIERDGEKTTGIPKVIESHLAQSAELLVLCSAKAAQSPWVNDEIKWFLEHRGPRSIRLAITEGADPGSHPEEFFSQVVIDAGLHKNIWYDFRGFRGRVASSWSKVRDFDSERTRLAADLQNQPAGTIQPIWFREQQRTARRTRNIALAVMVVMVLLTVAATVAALIAFHMQAEAERRGFQSAALALAAYAPREQEQGRQDERAALLALQAYRFHQQHEGTKLDQVDKALRQVLSAPYFSVILSGGGADLKSVAFSRNGQLLAAGGDDLKVRLWNLGKRGAAPTILRHKSGIVWSLAFSPNENILVAGTEEGHVLLWELEKTGQTWVARVLGDHDGKRVTSIAVSSGGEKLASGCVDGKVRVWNFRKLEANPIILSCGEQQSIVWSVAFHPTSSHTLASGCADGKVRIWDIRQPGTPRRVLPRHDNAVTSVAFSPDGSTIASGTDRKPPELSIGELIMEGLETRLVGGTVSLWDLQQKKPEPKILEGHLAKVSSLAFSKNGEILASAGSGDNTVRLWQINQLDDSTEVLRGHEGSVQAVAFSPDGKTLASVGSSDSSVRLWDMGRPSGAPIVLRGHQDAVQSLVFSPDGDTLASAAGDVRAWDFKKESEAAILDHDEGYAVAVAYSPNGKILASGSETRGIGMDFDNTVRLWDPADPREPWAVLPGHKSSVESLAFSSDDTLLASAGRYDKEIRLWELGRLKMETKPTVLETQARTTLSVKFARDDKVLACACSNNGDNTIRIWDRTQPGKEPLVLGGHKECINSISFGPDGWRLASGSDDGTVRLWDLHQPKEKPIELPHDGAIVYCVAIDPNGITLASGSSDGKVRLWDLTNVASDARVLPGPGRDVYAVAFSPDGRWLMAGGRNKTVVVWPRTKVLAEMVCKKVWRNLTEDEWSEFVGMGRYECTCKNLPSGKMRKSN